MFGPPLAYSGQRAYPKNAAPLSTQLAAAMAPAIRKPFNADQ